MFWSLPFIQRRAIFDALLKNTRPTRLWDLYAFCAGPSRYQNIDPKVRLLSEYYRLLGNNSYKPSLETIENRSYMLSNDWWRISGVNSNYEMSPTYPFAFIVPKSFRSVYFSFWNQQLCNAVSVK